MGSHWAEPESESGSAFHHWRKVPQTFAQHHHGPSATWRHAGGSLARLDYVVIDHCYANLRGVWSGVERPPTMAPPPRNIPPPPAMPVGARLAETKPLPHHQSPSRHGQYTGSGGDGRLPATSKGGAGHGPNMRPPPPTFSQTAQLGQEISPSVGKAQLAFRQMRKSAKTTKWDKGTAPMPRFPAGNKALLRDHYLRVIKGSWCFINRSMRPKAIWPCWWLRQICLKHSTGGLRY